MTRFDQYRSAVEQIEIACAAMDEALPAMRLGKVDQITSAFSAASRAGLAGNGIRCHLDQLLSNLQLATCEDCDQPLSEHGNPECECKWMLAKVGA